MQTGMTACVLARQGESTFVAMQLYYAMSVLRIFAEQKNDTEYIAYLDKIQKELGDIIQTKCWEDDRYIRGYKGRRHDHRYPSMIRKQTCG